MLLVALAVLQHERRLEVQRLLRRLLQRLAVCADPTARPEAVLRREQGVRLAQAIHVSPRDPVGMQV